MLISSDALDYDIDRDMLVGIYERVKANEFKPGNDHVSQVMKVQSTIVGAKLVRKWFCFFFRFRYNDFIFTLLEMCMHIQRASSEYIFSSKVDIRIGVCRMIRFEYVY